MEPQIVFEVVWQDDDVVELEVVVANGRFYGRSRVYTVYDDMSKLADALDGFPLASATFPEFLAGKSGSSCFFQARFYCFDDAGHTAARCCLEGNVATDFRQDEKDALAIEVQFEPLACEAFVSDLRALVRDRSGKACLVGIPRYTQNVIRET